MVRFNVSISSILGYAYFRYELTASDYNPSIDDEIDISCKVTSVFGNNVVGKTVTLYQNGVGVSSATTDANGVATWEDIQMSDWGLQDFSVEEAHCSVEVGGWRYLNGNATSTWALLRNKDYAKLVFRSYHPASNVTTSWVQIGSSGMASAVLPYDYNVGLGFVNTATYYVRVNPSNGNVQIRCGSGTIDKSNDFHLDMLWAINE